MGLDTKNNGAAGYLGPVKIELRKGKAHWISSTGDVKFDRAPRAGLGTRLDEM